MALRIVRLSDELFTISIALPAWVKAAAGAPGVDLPDDAAPRWNMLFPAGKVKYRDDFPEGIAFDEQTLGSFARNFERAKTQYQAESGFGLPVTFGHNHLFTDADDRRAAGWIEALSLDERGLFGLIRWTHEARERIGKDEFRYLSPEFAMNWDDSDSGKAQGPTLFGAALLNDPFLTEMPRVAATRRVAGGTSQTKGARTMDLKELLVLLGLSAETTEEEAKKVLAARLAATKKAEAEGDGGESKRTRDGDALALERAATKAALEERAAAEKRVSELVELNKKSQERLQALELAAKTAAAKTFCEGLVRAGRLVPAMAEQYVAFALKHGIEELQALVKDSPPIVDLKVHGTSETGVGGDKDAARKKFFALVDEATAKEKVSPEVATKRVRLQHPALAAEVFGG